MIHYPRGRSAKLVIRFEIRAFYFKPWLFPKLITATQALPITFPECVYYSCSDAHDFKIIKPRNLLNETLLEAIPRNVSASVNWILDLRFTDVSQTTTSSC